MAGPYHIRDEPEPGRLQHLVVNPSWALLAVMLCGAWLAWPWLALNAYALGSPTRRRELAMVGLGFAGTLVLALAVLWLIDHDVITGAIAIRMAVLTIVVWKLGLSYAVFMLQNRTFHVYEHYHGATRNGAIVLVAGFLCRPWVLDLSDAFLWKIIVSGWVNGL